MTIQVWIQSVSHHFGEKYNSLVNYSFKSPDLKSRGLLDNVTVGGFFPENSGQIFHYYFSPKHYKNSCCPQNRNHVFL